MHSHERLLVLLMYRPDIIANANNQLNLASLICYSVNFNPTERSLCLIQ